MVCRSHVWLCCRIFGVLRFELRLYYLFLFHVVLNVHNFCLFLTSLMNID